MSGNITNEYVFFAGRRIARIASGTVNYFYSDALGTIHTITDGTGHPCYDASFTPYGQEVLNPNISQTCSSNYKFTGDEYDPETGIYYAVARYYSPRFGRFMSTDTLGGDVFYPQSLNMYAYVLNDPCDLTDPLGLTPCDKDRVNFINSNLDTVQPVADSLKIPADYILGLSYLESHNPKGGFEPQATQFNNWFGVTASSPNPKSLPPFSNGVTNVNSTNFFTFPGPGIQQSLNWFKAEYGSLTTSAASPTNFGLNLVLHGYNSKNRNYADLIKSTIQGIQDVHHNCPEVKGNGSNAGRSGGGGGEQVELFTVWTLCDWWVEGGHWTLLGCSSFQ